VLQEQRDRKGNGLGVLESDALPPYSSGKEEKGLKVAGIHQGKFGEKRGRDLGNLT